MPTATVKSPDGAVLAEFSRRDGRRAVQSAKGHQIIARRVTEVDVELINTYEPGTKIECDGSVEVWDGKKWAPAVVKAPKGT